MSEQKFYRCEICGNLVGMIHSSGVPLVCCGQKMKELVPGEVDASQEKHVPVVTCSGDEVLVKIGSAAHPMTEEHHIEWVFLQTKNGGHRRKLTAGDEPTASFCVKGDEPVAVYAYCNLHGLWVKAL